MKDVFEREGLCPVITFGDRGMMEFGGRRHGMARSAGPNKSRESIALLHAARNCNAKDGAERKGGREGGREGQT